MNASITRGSGVWFSIPACQRRRSRMAIRPDLLAWMNGAERGRGSVRCFCAEHHDCIARVATWGRFRFRQSYARWVNRGYDVELRSRWRWTHSCGIALPLAGCAQRWWCRSPPLLARAWCLPIRILEKCWGVLREQTWCSVLQRMECSAVVMIQWGWEQRKVLENFKVKVSIDGNTWEMAI